MAEEEAAAVWVATSSLVPWAKNPRLNDHVVDDVVKSIESFGFGAPLLARKENGEIIAGHTRLKAAMKLGLDRVPVRYLDLDERKAHLLALADNRLSEKADWSLPELADILKDFDVPDIQLAGWNEKEFERLIRDAQRSEETEVVEDEVPDPPKDPVTQPGDVWMLGRHRLFCGDATKRESWARILDGQLLDLVFTDPPYGVDYVGKTADALEVANDDAAGLPALLAGSLGALLEVCREGAVWYVCAPPGPQLQSFADVLTKLEVWRQSFAWIKDVFVLGHSDFHYQHEHIFYGWKPGAHRGPPDRKQTSVWQFDRPKASREHPTMKPLKLVAHAMAMSSLRDELVGDAFAGSGTTLIAAEQLGRVCRTIELKPAYCDVVVQRYERLTGVKAERVSASDRA